MLLIPHLRAPPFLALDLDDFLPPYDAVPEAVDKEGAYARDDETEDEYACSCVRHQDDSRRWVRGGEV